MDIERNIEERITDQELSEISNSYDKIKEKVSQYIVGNQELLQIIFIGLLVDGNVLVEGIAGTAKSTLVKTVAQLLGCDFRRVQCGIDTQPADVIGIRIWDMQKREFVLQKGPIFTNVILIDEINRLPPKSQSAFIEAMGEQQATIDGITIPLERPYFTIATQNPFERQGTFPLIEAQKDRFMFSYKSEYLDGDAELEIIRRQYSGALDWHAYLSKLSPVLQKEELLLFSQYIEKIHIEDYVLCYIRDLLMATREHPNIQVGVSSRGSIALVKGVKALAAIEKRSYVIPDDVKRLTPFAFQHRLRLIQEAEISGVSPYQVVQEILDTTGVP
jgi:MoxR-like ATPase